MARNLPAVDSNGLADPYLIIRLAGQRLKFKKRKKTLNPQWFQTRHTKVNLQVGNDGSLKLAPHLQCFVFDWDAIGNDDPMGRFSVSCDKILNETTIHAQNPTWYHITTLDGQEIHDAKVLACFQLMDPTDPEVEALYQTPSSKKKKKYESIFPITTPWHLQIVTLGLRNVQSPLGVNKCLVDFELPNGKRYGTKTSREPSAKSPNFLQVLKIPIDLPNNPMLTPIVDISVRDTLMGGWVKRLIGAASLDLSNYLTRNEFNEITSEKKNST